MRDQVCRFIRDTRIILKALKRLAEDAVITFAVIYGLYTVCRILIG